VLAAQTILRNSIVVRKNIVPLFILLLGGLGLKEFWEERINSVFVLVIDELENCWWCFDFVDCVVFCWDCLPKCFEGSD